VLGVPSNDSARRSRARDRHRQYAEQASQSPSRSRQGQREGAECASRSTNGRHRTARRLPGWNFHKYLVGRDGHIAEAFPSRVEPTDTRIVTAIARALPA